MSSPRKAFKHDGRTIYEWEQSIDEVLIYINPPEGVLAKHLDIIITNSGLSVGLKGNPPFLNEKFAGAAASDESLWIFEDGTVEITISKAKKAELWPSALLGHGQLSAVDQEAVKGVMMRQRFQEEHPGFDFSDAEFSGAIPDARTFMGGVGNGPK